MAMKALCIFRVVS